LSLQVPARNAAAAAGLVVALAYALLAGFAVPAQRTLWMLAIVALALWLRVFATASGMLAAALLAVLLFDPMAVLAAGFWLSFGAVALRMYVTGGRVAVEGWVAAWSRTQWALFVGLGPLLLVLFQQVSVVAPFANAFAVPWVSFVVVPLSLLAAVIPWQPLALLAHAAMLPAGVALEWMAALPCAAWTQHSPPMWTVALALAGAVWLLLPRGAPSRWLGALAILPIVVAPMAQPAFGEAWVDVLDVGQGLAATVRTQAGALVFDTGPSWSPEADSGSRIVAPFLRGSGVRRLAGAIVSHDDGDHAGGAARLFEMVPPDWVASPLPDDHPALVGTLRRMPCVAGQAWEWSGVRFAVLHPDAASYGLVPGKDNARSCVLKVSSAGASVLFAGDIEKDSERGLIAQQVRLASDVIVVPHHGSRTSSTREFIAAVLPEAAIFSVGYRNRFGHPAPDVVARYRDVDARIVRTDEGGAIHLVLDATGWRLERWRDVHRRYWQEH
jgi:competence protein ComEC